MNVLNSIVFFNLCVCYKGFLHSLLLIALEKQRHDEVIPSNSLDRLIGFRGVFRILSWGGGVK